MMGEVSRAFRLFVAACSCSVAPMCFRAAQLFCLDARQTVFEPDARNHRRGGLPGVMTSATSAWRSNRMTEQEVVHAYPRGVTGVARIYSMAVIGR